MPRWPSFRRRAVEQPDTVKAVAPTGAHTFTADQVAALIANSNLGAQTTGAFVPLPRTDPQVAFGPGLPLIPAAVDPVNPATGRPEPRFNEYPVSSNLPGVTDRLVPWKVLRDAADVGGLARRCIEIRKNEVATLEWSIVLSKSAVEAARAADPTAAPSEVETRLRERMAAQIARCTTFWEKPDPGQDEDTSEWLSKLLEEHLVLDAVAIYPRRTYGGDLYALEILDGSTIKPLRDHRGGRPLPPNPAFQQILQGFPRGEFIADVDTDGKVLNGYLSDQLIYKRRNVRAHTLYGYSAVEQALEDIDVWLRRRKWIRDEYTEGTVPTGLLKQTGQGGGWTPQQTAEFETFLNDAYAGSAAARHRLRVLPPGFELEAQADVAERYKPEYDLFLIKQIASHFDVTLAELGFTEQGGLGSTGWHEGQADVQYRKATLPTLRWLQQLLTTISRKHLGMPPELEFRFLGLDEEGEAAADDVTEARVGSARMTLNEARDQAGLPRYDFPEADMPMIRTSRGLVFIDGASKLTPPGEVIDQVTGAPLRDADSDGILDAPHGPDNDTAGAEDDADGERADQVKAELAAYRRWARRNTDPARPFRFNVVTKADAPDLNGQHVVFAEDGDDTAPKAGDGTAAWPGWDRDQDTADLWAARIQRALTQAVDCEQLAERWLSRELVKADTAGEQPQDDSHTAEWTAALAAAFLTAQGIDLTGSIAATLTGVWAEGWAIGAASARSLLDRGRAAFPWRHGDHHAAGRTLTASAATALRAFTDQRIGEAQAVAGGRLRALARVLANALTSGWNARQLAQALRAALRDPAWAQMLALTELTRAGAEAARDTYTAAGISRWQWLTEPGACPVCLNNEAAEPRPIGQTWPDGSTAPPAHPRCRCSCLPA